MKSLVILNLILVLLYGADLALAHEQGGNNYTTQGHADIIESCQNKVFVKELVARMVMGGMGVEAAFNQVNAACMENLMNSHEHGFILLSPGDTI